MLYQLSYGHHKEMFGRYRMRSRWMAMRFCPAPRPAGRRDLLNDEDVFELRNQEGRGFKLPDRVLDLAVVRLQNFH